MDFFNKAKNLLIENEDNEKDNIFNLTEEDRKIYSTNDDISEENISSAEVDSDELMDIDYIYSINNLENKEKSIYKVIEIKEALPDMPIVSKKASVLGMLTISKIELDEIQKDSDSRVNSLIGSLEQFSQQTNKTIDYGEEVIAIKTKEIESLKNAIQERKALQEKQKELIENEINKIKNINDFILK